MKQQTQGEEVYSFGTWLRRQRKAHDWTQAALAQRVGCTEATIRKIEADERKPSQQLADLLATALTVPDEARAAFLQAARQVQAVAHLPSISPMPVPTSSLHPCPHKPSHNLPAPMTSLVDRLHDTATVARLLLQADVRLLTLLGPPGIGKTRLAIHSAEQVAPHFRDGVWFVDLAALTDAELVLPAIAYVLTVAEAGAIPLLERLCARLAEKQLLLVLDNCEQVSAAASEVGTLLRGSKGLKILATSRVPLLLAGEHEYALPPLSLPPRDLASNVAPNKLPEQLMTYEAVQLFVARVRQHQYDFAITSANAEEISIICIRLDGIPLALELAAAALRRMTLKQLVTLLHHNDDAKWLYELQSPARDLPARQRTLYQAIAWSYRLLDTNLQMIFRQLGYFVGGFTAAAAQAVCHADQTTLTHLTEHNLLVRTPGRWQMLAMIREFALAQMSNDERNQVQQRHTTYFAAQAELKLALSLEVIAQDHDNFRTALASAIAQKEAHAALTLCIKLVWFWEAHGYLREGVSLVRAALALPADWRLRFALMERMSTLAWQVHQFDVALTFSEQMTTLAYTQGDPGEVAFTLNLKGRILIEQGEYDHAEAVLTESVQLARQIPHRFNPGCPLAQLGEVALARGDRESAHRQLTEALTLLTQQTGDFYIGICVSMAHTDLAELALVQNDPAQAHHELRQILPYAHLYMRRVHCLLVALAGLLLTPLPATPTTKTQAAAILLGAIAGLGERTGNTLSPFHQRLTAERSASAQRCLSQHEWQAAWQQGHAWTLAQAAAAAEKWLAPGFMG